MAAHRWIRLLSLVLGLAGVGLAPVVAAHEDRVATRVGRVADVQGTLWAWDGDQREWVTAWRNRPVAEGDRFAVGAGDRAELRIGRSELRLGADSELEVLALDDARIVVELHRGALAWRLGSTALARQAEVRTREGSLRPLAEGHYRIDRGDDGPTWAAVWHGRLEFVGGGNLLQLDTGERVELRAYGHGRDVRTRRVAMPRDELDAWARRASAPHESGSWRHVSPDVPGSEDLDRHGRWDRHPEYGAVWLPHALPAGWAPFAHGRWVWVRPWGWTWVDAMPWGFAPSHYGRWLRWGGRWVWWPGPRAASPVFQPALVAWIGGAGVSFGISIGAGGVPPPPRAWVPLAPGQVHVPIVRPPPRRALPPPHRPPPRHAGPPPRHVYPVPPPRQVHPLPPPYARQAVASPSAPVREASRESGPPRAQRPDTQGWSVRDDDGRREANRSSEREPELRGVDADRRKVATEDAAGGEAARPQARGSEERRGEERRPEARRPEARGPEDPERDPRGGGARASEEPRFERPSPEASDGARPTPPRERPGAARNAAALR